MCHYFDSLRFYFKMKEKIKPYSESTVAPWQQGEKFLSRPNSSSTDKNIVPPNFNNSTKTSVLRNVTKKNEESQQKTRSNSFQNAIINKELRHPIGLKNLPFQFKSIMSLNYHQRFKGSLNPIRELFQISLPNSISFDKSLFNEFPINQNSFFHEESWKNSSDKIHGPSEISRGNSGGNFRGTGAFNEQRERIYNLFGSNDPFYIGWDKNLRKFILTSRFLSRTGSLNEQIRTDQTSSDIGKSNQSNVYRTYSSWPFFKSQLVNSIERPYSIMYENYNNILNKKLRTFKNVNISNVEKSSLTVLYTYSLADSKNSKRVSQLPQNIYKIPMQPTSSQDIFEPLQNTWIWPGSSLFSKEYFLQKSNTK